MVKITFLGTNGWYSTFQNTICTLIDSEKFYIVLDAGDGLHKLDEHMKKKKPVILFLSHLHLDHVIGLHVLNKFEQFEKLRIYGNEGTREGLETLIRHPYSADFNELPFETEIQEIPEGIYEEPFKFTCKPLVHADPCLGYRFELDNKVISYCTDTGKCDNIYKLAENADLLISECSFKSGQVESEWPHLNPEEAAGIARESNVKRLVLTHFDANLYRTMEEREEAEISAKKIFSETITARDGLTLDLTN